MNDFFKDKKITEINDNLTKINERMGNYWFAFGRGLLTGFGSVLGAGIAIIIIGWFLNVIGVIPAFKAYTDDLREVFQQTQNNKAFIPSEEPK